MIRVVNLALNQNQTLENNWSILMWRIVSRTCFSGDKSAQPCWWDQSWTPGWYKRPSSPESRPNKKWLFFRMIPCKGFPRSYQSAKFGWSTWTSWEWNNSQYQSTCLYSVNFFWWCFKLSGPHPPWSLCGRGFLSGFVRANFLIWSIKFYLPSSGCEFPHVFQ